MKGKVIVKNSRKVNIKVMTVNVISKIFGDAKVTMKVMGLIKYNKSADVTIKVLGNVNIKVKYLNIYCLWWERTKW